MEPGFSKIVPNFKYPDILTEERIIHKDAPSTLMELLLNDTSTELSKSSGSVDMRSFLNSTLGSPIKN
jgi:hypothetical protein